MGMQLRPSRQPLVTRPQPSPTRAAEAAPGHVAAEAAPAVADRAERAAIVSQQAERRRGVGGRR